MSLIRKLKVGTALVAALAFLFVGAAPASAVDDTEQGTNELTYRVDGDWVFWEVEPVTSASQEVVIQGKKQPNDSCNYQWTDPHTGAPDGEFMLVRETAHNAEDCILKAEKSYLPIDRLEDFDTDIQEGQIETASYDVGMAASAQNQDVQPLSSSTTVWLKTVYEDPAQIDVNNVYVEVSFSYNGSCVTNSWNHNSSWYYYDPTGWYLDSSDGQAAQNCSYAATEADGYFENYAWGDDSQLTWTNHRDTTVFGEEDGSQTNQYNLTKGGEDAGLLHTQILSS